MGWEGEIKLSLFTDNIIVCVGNTKESPKNQKTKTYPGTNK